MRTPIRSIATLGALALLLAVGIPVGQRSAVYSGLVQEAAAQKAPPQERPDAWYPRTEKVGPDEMFVVALGTGMPTPITRAQKSSAWYVELGNGDIFLFDIGSGSVENLFALRPEYGLDGPVSYRLDWNGLSFVFGGDSASNKWFIERARGADFVIHECFYTPEGLANTLGWDLRQATFVSSCIHTPPSGFGKIMAGSSRVWPSVTTRFDVPSWIS
jgi:hypothetical protein